jgi:phosphoribosylaminoimidazolecarboxamide formyltransferase / IMP cyclohydrolase
LKKLALISVSDKTNIVDFARELISYGYEIIATGNTAKLLSSSDLNATEVSSLTGFPEVFNGRVKTLHPKVFGGILYRRDNNDDLNEAAQNEIPSIDIVCVNLYPFKKTAENPASSMEDIVENIDIGGPSLIRASAKNYKYVSVLTNPFQYQGFINELKSKEISEETRQRLAAEAFSYTAEYDTYITNYLESKFSLPHSNFRLNYKKEKELRYGENPHQSAATYGDFFSYFEFLHGKELSYNNILDLAAAVELAEDLGENVCAIIKHQNPAGAAIGTDLFDAYIKALKCDPVSAFGGIVAFTSTVYKELAEKLNEIFLEVISAPDYTEEALNILMKKRDRRLLKQLKSVNNELLTYKNIPGGVIVQDKDIVSLFENELKVATDKKPANEEMEDLKFAWKIAKHTKSNAIVFAKDKAALGVGAGQMSRIDSVKIAAMKANEYGLDLQNSVAASDAFFPFADALLEIIKHGATSIIQPGGSIRDKEVIEAANQNNISMVFTGIRHFKH